MGKPIKRGAIAGIAYFFILILSIIIGLFINNFDVLTKVVINSVLSVAYYSCVILFFMGFVQLGKKANIKLLKVASYIFVVFTALLLVTSLIAFIYLSFANHSLLESKFSPALNQTGEVTSAVGIPGLVLSFLIGALVLLAVIFIFLIVLIILFGIGLIKLGGKFKIAKIAGIFNILVGCYILCYPEIIS